MLRNFTYCENCDKTFAGDPKECPICESTALRHSKIEIREIFHKGGTLDELVRKGRTI